MGVISSLHDIEYGGEKRQNGGMVRREVFIHLFSTLVFFGLVGLVRGWLGFGYLPFFVGGVVGAFLVDLDHLIYVVFLRPWDLTSQRVRGLFLQGRFGAGVRLLCMTREERVGLIFHSGLFQLVFFVSSFLVVSSSGSFLARGVVLSVMFHLSLEQFLDFREKGNIDSWFVRNPFFVSERGRRLFAVVMFLVLLLFSFVF
jgi:hypothetical protein